MRVIKKMGTDVDVECLIIGGAGFLASFLIKEFSKEGIHYVAADCRADDNSDCVYCDVTCRDSLERLPKARVAINLAAVHRDDVTPRSLYTDVNVDGAKNFCDMARDKEIETIIFTSSVAIYGIPAPDTDEMGEPNYFNEYGRTKYLAEKVYFEWQAEDPTKRRLVIIRPTVIFGPGNRGNVYNLLRQIANRRFVMFGSGMNKKSMAYVENVASFINYIRSTERAVSVFNYVDKPDLTMNQLVSYSRNILFRKQNVGLRLPKWVAFIIGLLFDLVAGLTGKKLIVSSTRVMKFMATTELNSDAAINTGFRAPYSLLDGLNKTIRYEFVDDNSGAKVFHTE